MQRTITPFDTTRPHIHVRFYVIDLKGSHHSLDGILDTGAPRSEFSDKFLSFAGFIKNPPADISMKSGLQTQKYGKVILPSVEIFGRKISDFEVFASRFEKEWGIDALIGLDFIRRFEVTISYRHAAIVTECLPSFAPIE
ncbi:MAG TPA: hypothetical protein DF383_10000 [Deltaproteobacteria bacterium]|nr:hypothetical protein [Deltaproteobacteria bacterium]